MSDKLQPRTAVTVLSSVSGEMVYSPADIARALGQVPTELRHGEQFTGRPATLLFVDAQCVVKLRTEISSGDRLGWTQEALSRERALDVHHPLKTWFLVHASDSTLPVAGNICPLLTPLHVAWREPVASESERGNRLDQLLRLIGMHLQARTAGWHLDLGLSNFGLDAEGRLYYLDDDVYPAHPEHAALGHMLGVCVRSQDWIDTGTARQLGEALRELIQDPHEPNAATDGLVELLAQLYVPEGRARTAHGALADALKSTGEPCASAGSRKHVGRATHRMAVLSDVHANLPALEAAIEFVASLRIDRVIVLGDIVGYGPHPVECIERMAETRFQCIKGNHDYICALEPGEEPAHPVAMSRDARRVAEWTAHRVSPEHRRWLRELPGKVEGDGWLAVHGAPIDPNHFNGYVYEMTYERNLDELQTLGLRICFHGHTHVRGIYARTRRRPDAFYADDAQSLDKYLHALVCPGSIGQPRNALPGAQLALYDRDSRVVQFYSIAYDMDRTISDMERYNFPRALIQRLQTAT